MQALGSNLIEIGEFRLDTEKKILWRAEQVVSLPLKSIELLCMLIENRGKVVSKEALMQQVWKNSFVEESVLTQNIYLLRKTLQTKGNGKSLIKNVPRRGYLFGGAVREIETNGTSLIIERHLFEKIEIEEENPQAKTPELATPEKIISPYVAVPPLLRHSAVIIAAFLVLSLASILTYLYFRNGAVQIVTTGNQRNRVYVKSGSVVSVVKSLTVVPFAGADEHLSNFFASDLVNRFGSLNKFSVKPFAIVRKHSETSAELKSDYVLDGEIKQVKNQIRVNVRLIDLKNNAEVWMGNFENADAIQLQDAITNRAAQAILNELTPEEHAQISKKLPTNIAAYETYQNGFLLLRQRADGSAPYFKRAIELDGNFAQAYALLANVRAMSDVKDSPEAEQTRALLAKAFAIDENLPDAFAVQGFMQIFHERDWQGAEKSLRTALELDATNVNAHHWLAVYYSIHRKLDEAKKEMQIALELDPTNPTLLGDLAQLHYFAGEKEEAKKYCESALALAPNHVFAKEYLYQINQPPAAADRETTLEQLNQAVDQNVFILPYINVDPRYDHLREDPRFQEILRKINL